MELSIFIGILLFVIIIQSIIPFILKKTIIFGVAIPVKHVNNAQLSGYKKRYAALVLFPSTIFLLGYLIWGIQNPVLLREIALFGTSIQLGVLIWSICLYFFFRGKVLQLKKKAGWYNEEKNIQITELGIRQMDEMLPWYVFAIPMLITIGLILFTYTQYHFFPNNIPVHWGLNGQPDRFTEKNPISVISLLLALFTTQGMFLGIHELTKRSGIKVSASNVQGSKWRSLRLRKYSSWLLLLISVLMTVLFSFLQLSMIYSHLFSGMMMILIPLVFLVLTLGATVWFALKVERLNSQELDFLSDVDNNTGKEVMDTEIDRYWKGGLFYFNKKDPSIFVEKRFGVGWTLNFAHPIGYLLIFVPLIIILFLSFL